ncbi:transmembrane protein 44 [Alca torda]
MSGWLSCGCPGQGRRQASILCLLYSFLGHVCNTIGALLASQLGIQVLTGAYMAMADIIRFLLTLFPPCPPESQKTAGLCRDTPPCHRHGLQQPALSCGLLEHRVPLAGQPGTGTVGTAAPGVASWHPGQTEGGSVATGMGEEWGGGPITAHEGGMGQNLFLKVTPCPTQVHPAGGGGGGGGRGCGMVCSPLPCPCPVPKAGPGVVFGSPGRTQPLHPRGWGQERQSPHTVALLVKDNREVLGFVLGLLSALIALTARIPALSRACRGKPCPWRRLWATLCSATAGILYAAAIVTHGQQPAHVLRALPWLLIALGSAALDVALLFIACTAKSQTSQRLVPEVADAWAPLAGEGEEEDDGGAEEEEAANWVPLHMFPKPKTGPRMVATSHSLDLIIRLVQQVRGCWGPVQPPGLGQSLGGSGMLSPLWQGMGSLQMLCAQIGAGGVDASSLLPCTAGRGQHLADVFAM